MDQIKSSNIKLKYDLKEVEEFVVSRLGGNNPITKLVEGHTSQAFSFTHKDGINRALRIAPKDNGFQRDKYAYENFSSVSLPIPKVIDIGDFSEGAYYCVSQFAEGKPSDQLSPEEMKQSLDDQLSCFAQLFKADISDAVGWGEIDVETGKAPFDTWHESVWAEVENLDESLLKTGLLSLGLGESLYDALRYQFESNISQLLNPVKRLVHGDLGFDNVLVSEAKVTAIIDWADIGYGDWVFDMARCEFWHPGKYGSIREFGERFDLDCNKLDQRINVCISFVALTTLDYAIRYESDSTMNWLKIHLPSKIL